MSKKHFLADATTGNTDEYLVVPLRDWMASEAKRADEQFHDNDEGGKRNFVASKLFTSKEANIRKTTIAYGILELILRCRNEEEQSNHNVDDIIEFDNFSVHVSEQPSPNQPWDDIRGVSMLSPKISLAIEEPAYLSCLFDEGGTHNNVQYGRHLEVELISNESRPKMTDFEDCRDEPQGSGENIDQRYHLVAKILYVLFAGEAYLDDENNDKGSSKEPAQKKAKKSFYHQDSSMEHQHKCALDKANVAFQIPPVKRMQQLKIPTSICLMVQNLLEATQSDSSNDSYTSMNDVARDLHLLLLDPDRFLFDADVEDSQSIPLRYREDKLYGRDEEEKLITDAFCRVTRGNSEAFFIKGFSGCGKSMLVDTLRERVHAVGGYVIKHKFDALSQEKPLSGVISAVNQLCALIKSNTTTSQLVALAEKIKDEFRADLVLLSRILQSISELSIDLVCANNNAEDDEIIDAKMNARSVGHTLLRFLRLVSSHSHPIMLFLDDLQWTDDTALDVVHMFLSDTTGSCMFLVGTYRDNEVDAGHPVFNLMKTLESSDVPTSKVALTGLRREDLNTMISDALCLYPRMCYSLTDVVIQKTSGNPFFILEFIKSLKSRGILQYNFYQKRWVWDEEVIRAENITDNVMHLLSQKMTALSDNLHLALKVMACFGTCTKEMVMNRLNVSSEYAGVGDGLKRAVDKGFVEKSREGEYKFVHDKIREAAYNLIPESDKKQFHYDLGRVLHANNEGEGKDDKVILSIASQIYLGKDCIPKDDKLWIPIFKLIVDAGKKAFDSCHHETAYRYLATASSLLPNDCWENYYDICLRVNLLTANAANASCKYDEAVIILKKIIHEGHCAEDKVPSHSLLSQIFQGLGKVTDAYDTCSSILAQLGETVSGAMSNEEVQTMIGDTVKMYDEIVCDEWLETKMQDKTLQSVAKLYTAMLNAACFFKSEDFTHYLTCKMVQLSLRNGTCQSTPVSFLYLSGIINLDGSKAALAHRIASSAMSIAKNSNFSPDQMADAVSEYVYTVGYLESFHLGVRNLRSGFESALSSGNTEKGFHASTLSIMLSIISGEKKLTLLLKEVDYYLHLLETYSNEMMKTFLLIYRRTISTLIDKGEATSSGANDAAGEGVDDLPQIFVDMVNVNKCIQSYWLGHQERCCHYAKKCLDSLPSPGKEYRVIVLFYYGLALIDMLKKKMSVRKKNEVKEVVSSMKISVSHANFNFRNKLELLQAEQFALVGHHSNAVTAYDTAIASANKCEFIHEEGLAYEKAGLYFKSIRDVQNAIRYFDRALLCYDEWGSRMKVEIIEKELSALSG